ncbi:MAG TPA: hypothetical protein VE130_10790 [Nitrososphaeraceae archaeon]|jgi:hypothetical protein|nr:hypothetical protein [Nitrososphaeraceae archaeon]
MTYKKDITEYYRIQDTIRQINQLLTGLQERLTGLKQKELNHTNIQEVDEYQLKIIKGMSNRELDFNLFEVLQTHNFLSDYLGKLSSEKEKRIKYGLIPIDGTDWEADNNGLPSIGPRIDTIESIDEKETRYV